MCSDSSLNDRVCFFHIGQFGTMNSTSVPYASHFLLGIYSPPIELLSFQFSSSILAEVECTTADSNATSIYKVGEVTKHVAG